MNGLKFMRVYILGHIFALFLMPTLREQLFYCLSLLQKSGEKKNIYIRKRVGGLSTDLSDGVLLCAREPTIYLFLFHLFPWSQS